jgi:hypothetical protein
MPYFTVDMELQHYANFQVPLDLYECWVCGVVVVVIIIIIIITLTTVISFVRGPGLEFPFFFLKGGKGGAWVLL